MPYSQWHSARIRQPGRFVRIRVLWARKGILAYGGPLKTDSRGGIVISSIRFDRKKFTVNAAKKWLRDHRYKYIQFEAAIGKN